MWKIYSISCSRDKNNFSPWEGMKNVELSSEEKLENVHKMEITQMDEITSHEVKTDIRNAKSKCINELDWFK